MIPGVRVGGQCGEVRQAVQLSGGCDVIGARCPDIICVSRYIGPGLGKDLSLQPLWRPAHSQEVVSTLHSSATSQSVKRKQQTSSADATAHVRDPQQVKPLSEENKKTLVKEYFKLMI